MRLDMGERFRSRVGNCFSLGAERRVTVNVGVCVDAGRGEFVISEVEVPVG